MKCPLSGGASKRLHTEVAYGTIAERCSGARNEGARCDFKAMAKSITWWQAAEILGISVRSMRRWRARYERHGYDGLVDRRKGRSSPKRVAVQDVERALGLYRQTYYDFNVRHFHEKLKEEHKIKLSYTWVRKALLGAGLIQPATRRQKHRKRRPRRPLPGMMLHIDGSTHHWFQHGRCWDLIVIVDDARRLHCARSDSARRGASNRETNLPRRSKRHMSRASFIVISSPRTSNCGPDGAVKVLDFGLAKLAESAGGGQPTPGTALSISPTIS
jgi:transposase